MEILIFLVAVFFLIMMPGFVFALMGRVRSLEEQVQDLNVRLSGRAQKAEEDSPYVAAKSAALAKKKVALPFEETRQPEQKVASVETPPALPVVAAEKVVPEEAPEPQVAEKRQDFEVPPVLVGPSWSFGG